MTALTITIRQADEAGACDALDTWREKRPDCGPDDPVLLTEVLDVLGVDAVLWALGVLGERRVLTDWACACADHVAHLAGDAERVCRTATRVARLCVRGLASDAERHAARYAALAAALGNDPSASAMAAAWAAVDRIPCDTYRAAIRAAYRWHDAGIAEQEWQTDLLRRMVGGES